jgi:hypothetical protein
MTHVGQGLQTVLGGVAAGLLGIFSSTGYWWAKYGDFNISGGVHG